MLDLEPNITVDLWTARIPWIGCIAEHHWLVVSRGGSADRWEVWQLPDQCENSWGHLHCNLQHPAAGVGNGDGRMIERWSGDDGERLAVRIEATPNQYPWRDRYRAFPGPNSNTYVQWVLGPLHTIGWRGIGRRFARHASHAV